MLIVAGGLGKRLRPITNKSPKPMVNDKLSTKVLSEYLALAELNTKSKKKRGYI